MGISISANKKDYNYNLILVIINWLMKIIYYELIKVTINIPSLVEMINNIIVRHHRILELIFIN